MTYLISKDFHFSAAHRLDGLPDGHRCGRLHGHNYIARVEIIADDLDDCGFVIDYGDLDPFGDYIDRRLDHRILNDAIRPNPTAENLSRVLRKVVLRECCIPDDADVRVWVSETPKTWAVYRP